MYNGSAHFWYIFWLFAWKRLESEFDGVKAVLAAYFKSKTESLYFMKQTDDHSIAWLMKLAKVYSTVCWKLIGKGALFDEVDEGSLNCLMQ